MLVSDFRRENIPLQSVSRSRTTLDLPSDAGMHDPTAAGTEPRRNSRPRRSDGRQSNGRLLPQSAAVRTVRINSAGGKNCQCGVPFQRPSGRRELKFRAIARIRQFDPRVPTEHRTLHNQALDELEIQEAYSDRLGSLSSKTNVDRGAPDQVAIGHVPPAAVSAMAPFSCAIVMLQPKPRWTP